VCDIECLQSGSTVPLSVEPVLTADKRERLSVIMRQSPRTYGKARSVWTLKLLAEVCYEQGLSGAPMSAPTILDAVVRLGTSWKRAKHWIVSPDPDYALKKTVGEKSAYNFVRAFTLSLARPQQSSVPRVR
jgi:hypothetical protein